MVDNIVEFIKSGEVKDFWKKYDPVHFQSNQMKVTNDRTTAYRNGVIGFFRILNCFDY